MTEPKYTHADAKRVGIPVNILQGWLASGAVVPDLQLGNGHGGRKVYSGRNLVGLGLAYRLYEHGPSAKEALEMADIILTLGARQFAADPSWPGDSVYDWKYWVPISKDATGYSIPLRASRTLAELYQLAEDAKLEIVTLVDVGAITGKILAALDNH